MWNRARIGEEREREREIIEESNKLRVKNDQRSISSAQSGNERNLNFLKDGKMIIENE